MSFPNQNSLLWQTQSHTLCPPLRMCIHNMKFSRNTTRTNYSKQQVLISMMCTEHVDQPQEVKVC